MDQSQRLQNDMTFSITSISLRKSAYIIATCKPVYRLDRTDNHLAPLAGRGRLPRLARLPGEGEAFGPSGMKLSAHLGCCAVAKTPLTPTLSPQARRGSFPRLCSTNALLRIFANLRNVD